MKKPFDSSLQLIKPDGTPTLYFIELLQSLTDNGLNMPVATTEPANGNVLTFNGTTKKWEPA